MDVTDAIIVHSVFKSTMCGDWFDVTEKRSAAHHFFFEERRSMFIDDIAGQAAEKFPEDIDRATDQAEREFWKHPEHDEWIRRLVRDQLRSLIHGWRHIRNTQKKKSAGGYGGPAKVNKACNSVANASRDSFFSYCIAGTTLGSMTGIELKRTAESERAMSNGHLFNATLCEELAKVVPDEKTVKESVSEKKLNIIVDRSRSKMSLAAAS